MNPTLKILPLMWILSISLFLNQVKAQNSEFYGLFMQGGINGTGAIFKTDGNGDNFQEICSFPPKIEGACPVGSLCAAPNGKYYGKTHSGGTYDCGVIFEWDIATNKITKKFDFNSLEKTSQPYVTLIPEDNGKFIWLNSLGIINEWDPVSNTLTEKYNVKTDEDSHSFEYSRLIKAKNGKYYGVAASELYDELFEWDPFTNIFIRWDVFDHSGDQMRSRICGSLTEADNGKLYGITSGSGYVDEAFIFEWNTSNNTYTKKLKLNDALNNYPYGPLIQADNGRFYGILSGSQATIFEWDTTTNICVNKYKCPDLETHVKNDPGRFNMMQASNGKIYGIFETILNPFDGMRDHLYEWDPATNIFRITKYFDHFVSYPSGGIIEVKLPITQDTIEKVDLLKGLIAYYPFNGNANDESGNGHHGTANGGTLTQNRFGRPNGAYHFTGETNRFSFKGFQLNNPVMTLCTWVQVSDEDADTVFLNQSMLHKIMLSIVNHRYQLELSFGGNHIILGDENGVFEIDPQNPRFDFLMLSYDGTQIEFRINDQAIAYKNLDRTILNSLFPVTMNNDINYSFHGLLDEIRIFSRLFSDTERHYLMTDTYKTRPTVTTDSVTKIGKNMATIHSTVRFEEGKNLYKFGICWGTSPNPDTANLQLLKYLILNDTVTYITLTGLLPNTTYYARMVAMKESGIDNYNELIFKTLPEFDCGSVTDIDGNIYKTVQIGSQTWMAENLKTTKYKDGTPIPLVTDNELWGSLVSPAYCWFNNDTSFKDIYGALYNGFAVSTGNLCPTGWHVPINTEWTSIFDYLGCLNECGSMLKETGTAHWISPNDDATNESGFTALPGSYRTVNGFDTRLGQNALWWTSTEDTQTAWGYYADGGGFHLTNETKKLGCSVRCLMDEKDTTSQVDLKKGLVAFYPFNGNAYDESGNGNHGVVLGAELTNDRFGYPNSAYYFNGIDNYIEVADNPAINFDKTTNFSIVFWFKLITNEDNGAFGMIDKGTSNADVYGLDLILVQDTISKKDTDVRFKFGRENEAACLYNIDLPSIKDNRWHMIVAKAIREKDLIQLYQDGVLVAELALASIHDFIMSSDASLKIGVDRLFYYYFAGNMDDIRIYNRALNNSEISVLYNEKISNEFVLVNTPAISTFLNSTFEIPVDADKIKSMGDAVSFQFDFTYNNQKLQYKDCITTGTMTANGSIQVNSKNDKISIAWAGQNTLADSGTLVRLRFKALESGAVTPAISNFLLNKDTIRNITNGTITITNAYGDVDGNNAVQAYDAALALQYSVGLDPLPDNDPLPWDDWRIAAANVDGQDGISAYDASLILQYTVGLINSFSVQGMKKSTHEPPSDITVSVEDRTIIFRSSGDLHGLNLSVAGIDYVLGAPQVINPNILVATSTTSSCYSVGLATAYTPSENEIILKIPLIETITQPVRIDMKINNRPKLIELGVPTPIADPLINIIEMYPNPANTILYFKNLVGEASIIIYDSQGRSILTRRITNNQVDISILDRGIYTIHIENGENTIIRKLIKY